MQATNNLSPEVIKYVLLFRPVSLVYSLAVSHPHRQNEEDYTGNLENLGKQNNAQTRDFNLQVRAGGQNLQVLRFRLQPRGWSQVDDVVKKIKVDYDIKAKQISLLK